jgi:E3 ubiquitin-protein ligase MARCH6
MGHLSVWTSASNLTVASESSSSTTDFMSSLPDYLGFTEPYFAALGSKIRLSVTQVQSTWIRLALGSGPANRVFAVCLGYVVVCLLFCLYLNILTVGNARSAGIVVRNAVRQQLLVLKVCFLSVHAFSTFAKSFVFPLRLLHSSSSNWSLSR